MKIISIHSFYTVFKVSAHESEWRACFYKKISPTNDPFIHSPLSFFFFILVINWESSFAWSINLLLCKTIYKCQNEWKLLRATYFFKFTFLTLDNPSFMSANTSIYLFLCPLLKYCVSISHKRNWTLFHLHSCHLFIYIIYLFSIFYSKKGKIQNNVHL